MGRRAVGRKYSKHISIQVLEEHNSDLKALANKLNSIAPLANQKKWTIRDVILTLVYGTCKDSLDPTWFLSNHFESLEQVDLSKIRSQLSQYAQTDISKKTASRRSRKSSTSVKTTRVKPAKKDDFAFTINPNIIQDLEQRKFLAGED
ncbi:MAG: hypothetical protein ACXAD7_07450 [Candidatus Kariarchaeaceae archaeon]|jgi:hypothetical protein